MRASDRAFVMPFAAGISAAWYVREFGPVDESPNAPFRWNAFAVSESPPNRESSGLSESSLGSASPPISGATRGSSSSGKPIQNSSSSGVAISSWKNEPKLFPLMRRTTSPTSHP